MVEHPMVKQDIIVQPVEYVIPERYNYFVYTLGMGALDKYSEYFNYTTRLNECDNNMKLAE